MHLLCCCLALYCLLMSLQYGIADEKSRDGFASGYWVGRNPEFVRSTTYYLFLTRMQMVLVVSVIAVFLYLRLPEL